MPDSILVIFLTRLAVNTLFRGGEPSVDLLHDTVLPVLGSQKKQASVRLRIIKIIKDISGC